MAKWRCGVDACVVRWCVMIDRLVFGGGRVTQDLLAGCVFGTCKNGDFWVTELAYRCDVHRGHHSCISSGIQVVVGT
jgi:hypothetical protein